ncbi:hypothetical protein Acr_00g0083320 [Actinidia rufa]|uniref:Uncharacterized protein n=1 Tax=Actinidia rufa TaxID=165716 RepID=A0A7J0DXE4_9ERIC|nr:hypothetical protein Acr_00g0083320 [Actinidia rufa]
MNKMLLPPSNHILPPADYETRNKIPNPEEFLVRKESFIQQEEQISVDPISVKESAPKFNGMSLLPLPLPPSKIKFLSTSLPNSATSSPKKKKKSKNQCHLSPSPIDPLEGRGVSNGVGVSFRRNEAKAGGDHGQNKIGIEGVDRGQGRRGLENKWKRKWDVISRTVSLEKIEFGSWTSSAIVMDNVGVGHDKDSGSLFFDLPLELIRSTVNDSDLPVTTAFVFGDKERKGVLKTDNTT